MKNVAIGEMVVGNDQPLTLIAGPCQLESLDHALMLAEKLRLSAADAGLGFIFKGSYDKANRTSLGGARGVGRDEGLAILGAVRDRIGCPVLTDVHLPQDCAAVAEVADVLQIPAFLSRQTDLLVAAGKTGAAINIKKGQFLAPWDMEHVVAKVTSTGNENVLLTERGTSFGYNTLVTDMRALPRMAQTGRPVIMDATHAVQMPGGQGGASGGERAFAPVLARAAVALGIAAVFLETHEDPDNAPSDGPNMIPLDQMPELLSCLAEFDQVAKRHVIKI